MKNRFSPGVPTQLAVPERQTVGLLSEHDLLLFPADPAEPTPRTRSRRLIGYVTRDPEVIALKLADPVGEGPAHPMVLAARWMAQARCCGASPLPADVGTATMGP